MSIAGFVDSIGRDLRYALRGLSRRPAFTFAAVLTLALGVAATTAIFSVVYSVLIKPLPYPNADELVQIRYSAAGYGSLPSPPSLYFTYRDESRTFASSGLWQPGGITLTGGGEPERVNALRVTGGILRALGVQPMRGRSFTEDEYRPEAEGPAPVILSYAFWQRRFGGDEAIIGRELSSGETLLEGADNRVDSRPSQVVGIMPPDFRFLELTPQPDVILALQLSPPAQPVTGENYNFGSLIRLEVRQDDGDDLRVFVANELGHRARIHPLERLEALALAAETDAIHERIGLFVAQRADQHPAYEIIATDAERSLALQLRGECIEHAAHFIARHAGELGHGAAETLHVLRAHVLENFRRLGLTERQQQDGGALDATAALGYFRHRSPPRLSQLALRASDPARPCRAPRPLVVHRQARALPLVLRHP